MDIDGRQETPEPTPDPTRCPSCAVPYRTALDQRYGYCWEEHDFIGEPTDFVFHGDEAFGERVSDKMRHMPPRDYPVMTDEEREQMWEKNRDAFRYEERMALTIMSGLPVDRHLIGAFGHGATLYEKVPTRWQRLRGCLRGRRPAKPVTIDEHGRFPVAIGLSPGARLLAGQDAFDHLVRSPRPWTWRERLRARLSARR